MKRISVVIPWHFMDNWQFYLTRCLKSIEAQTFTDYEVVLIKHSTMPVTSNRVIEAATGELVKVLYMDDYLAHGNALQEISDNFTKESNWLISGCLHDDGSGPTNYHEPKYNDQIYTGVNTVGSPSVLTFRREGCLFFDERLSYLLDCDLYKRLHDTYGPPVILKTPNVVIGIHPGQVSNLMPTAEKNAEYQYIMQKYHG